MKDVQEEFFTREEGQRFMDELKNIYEKNRLKLRLLQNPNLKKFLWEKGIPFFGELGKYILRDLLKKSLDVEDYDRRFQENFHDESFQFFSDVRTIVRKCMNKDKAKTLNILLKFMYLPSIEKIRKRNVNIVSETLMDEEVFKLRRKYAHTSNPDRKRLKKEVNAILTKVEFRTENILDFPNEVEKVAKNIANEIKNHYETSSDIAGVLLAFFDLLTDGFRGIGSYFNEHRRPSKKRSSWKFYKSLGHKGREFRIEDYMKDLFAKKYGYTYESVKSLFEEWLLETIAEFRHYKSHGEHKVDQDKLDEGTTEPTILIEIKPELSDLGDTLRKVKEYIHYTGLSPAELELIPLVLTHTQLDERMRNYFEDENIIPLHVSTRELTNGGEIKKFKSKWIPCEIRYRPEDQERELFH